MTPQRIAVKAAAWRKVPVDVAPSRPEGDHAQCVTAEWFGGSTTTPSLNAWCVILSLKLLRKALTMFRIDLGIAGSGILTGLRALDERRRLGLPDDSRLCIYDRRTSCWFEVTEAFARQHFRYDDNDQTATVPLSALTKDDVAIVNHCLVIRDDITDERAMELFAAHYVKEDVSCSG